MSAQQLDCRAGAPKMQDIIGRHAAHCFVDWVCRFDMQDSISAGSCAGTRYYVGQDAAEPPRHRREMPMILRFRAVAGLLVSPRAEAVRDRVISSARRFRAGAPREPMRRLDAQRFASVSVEDARRAHRPDDCATWEKDISRRCAPRFVDASHFPDVARRRRLYRRDVTKSEE